MRIWVAEAVCPYQSIAGVYRSLGAAVRAAKKEVPDAEWERIGHLSLCGGGGYALSGRRKVSPWAYKDYREHEYLFYRFTRRTLQPSAAPQEQR